MPPHTRLLLVRHAESASNVAGVIDTRPPGAPLSERGRTQAEALAERLARLQVAAVWSSTALRAAQTAAPVAARHGLDVISVEDLREADCGQLEGSGEGEARAGLERVSAQWDAGFRHAKMPGGESWNDIEQRMLRAILRGVAEVTCSTPGADVVMVGHAGSLRIAVNALAGPEASSAVGYPTNTGVVMLVRNESGIWELAHHDGGQASVADALAPTPAAPTRAAR